jgi:hypothetical protein
MYGMLSMSRRASNGEFKLKIRDFSKHKNKELLRFRCIF